MPNVKSDRDRAERMLELIAKAQEKSITTIMAKMEAGTATAADMKLIHDAADKAGLVLDPEKFAQTLRDRLPSTVDPKKFTQGDADLPPDCEQVN